MGTHHARSAIVGKRSASTALAGTHNLADTDPRAGTGPFPKPRALVLPLVHFGQSKPERHSGIDTADSDLMHHQFRLSLLQWNPGPTRRNPTNIVSAACGKFHAVILQEAGDHVPHISDQFMAYTGNTDLAILLNKDTYTFTMSWLRNVMHLLSSSSAFMDICGSTTSTSLVVTSTCVPFPRLATCLQMMNSQHPAIHFCGDLVHWRSRVVNVLVFSSCQSGLSSGVCIHMAATSLTMLRLAWDLETNLLISRCSFIFALLICLDPAVSCVVSKHNKEDLSADTTKNVCRDDVHDRAPVYQGFLSVSFPTLLRLRVSLLVSLLFLTSPLTPGRFDSSLCLSLSLSLSLSLCLCCFALVHLGGDVVPLSQLVLLPPPLGGAVSLRGFWVVLGTNQFGRSRTSGSPNPESLRSLVLGLLFLGLLV